MTLKHNMIPWNQGNINNIFPYFVTFYIDASSVSKAKAVKMLYELHFTFNNICNILLSKMVSLYFNKGIEESLITNN